MIWPFENDTSAIIKNMAQKSIAYDVFADSSKYYSSEPK